MKIDINYRLDGFTNKPVGQGSYVVAELYFYHGCNDKPDCRAGSGWPAGTIERRYDDFAKCYEVLFGAETGVGEDLLRHVIPEGKTAYTEVEELKAGNVLPSPKGIFKNSAGMPISVHERPNCGGCPLVPGEWTSAEAADEMANELANYAVSKGFLEMQEYKNFREFLLRHAVFYLQ